jgi:Spy/CpxP family protein refolding chaperone
MKANPSPTMKILAAFALMVFIATSSMAQPDQEDKSEKITAAKVAYITSRLNLTTAQAQQFWPVFNEFEAARKKIRKQMRLLRVEAKISEPTEDEVKADIKKMFALRQEELDLEKQYSEKFLKVITARQLAEYYRSEKEFTKLLLNKLKERRGGMGPLRDMD